MGIFLCGLSLIKGAEAAKDEVVVSQEDKAVSGEVGFINSDFISIIDSQGDVEGYEHEQLMYLDKDVEVKSKSSLSEIKLGDTVQIDYEEKTKASKGVNKKEKAVKTIKFLRAAKTKDSSLKSGKK